MAALALGASMLTGGLSGCGGGDDGSSSSSTVSTIDATSTTAPIGAPVGGELTGIRHLEKGDCFDLRSDSKSMTRAVWKLDCAKPHRYEIYADFDFELDKSSKGAPYPGAPVVGDQAEQRCYEEFEPFVGLRWTVSDLDIRTWWPSQESWNQNDRRILCAVTPTDSEPLTGTQQRSGR